jgi:exosome complex exonuclease DIS3/RRP44
MLHSKSFVKKTKKGKVMKVSHAWYRYLGPAISQKPFDHRPHLASIKTRNRSRCVVFTLLSIFTGNLQVVREHYLRDDIYSGSPLDPQCDPSAHKLAPDAAHYLMLDTNVALHQMDFLEHAAITDVIVASVVLEEVRARNSSAYQRLRTLIAAPTKRFFVFANEHHRETYITAEPGESPNDRNDRAIRVAACWYASRLPTMKIIFLSDDVASRRKAAELGLEAMSASQYAKLRGAEAPELVDVVAAGREAVKEGEDGDEFMDIDGGAVQNGAGSNRTKTATKGGPTKRRRIYEAHRPMSEITAGLKSGKFHQGTLRVNRFNPFEGWVGSVSVGEDILLRGREAMNRAVEGDVVAVEVLPEDQWQAPAARLPKPQAGERGTKFTKWDGERAAAADGAEDEDEEGLDEAHIAQVDPGEHYGGVVDALLTGTKRPTGRVVGIIRRNWRTRGYCGSLQPLKNEKAPSLSGNTISVLFCPVERRYPKVRLQTRQAAVLADKRIVVAIDSWEADSMYPQGHYVRTLGDIGDKDVETEVVLIENDINTAPFTPAVHACVPPLPWSVSDADVAEANRVDLRHLPVCSVDPPGCKDIDDALHVRRLDDGFLEVGVHIADVTHFVHPGTAMDIEAAAR